MFFRRKKGRTPFTEVMEARPGIRITSSALVVEQQEIIRHLDQSLESLPGRAHRIEP